MSVIPILQRGTKRLVPEVRSELWASFLATMPNHLLEDYGFFPITHLSSTHSVNLGGGNTSDLFIDGRVSCISKTYLEPRQMSYGLMALPTCSSAVW